MQPVSNDVDGEYEIVRETSGENHRLPAVVFVAGAGEGSRDGFAAVLESLADQDLRTVTYSRSGLGYSPARPDAGPRSSGDAAAELHDLLEDIAPPYVLVGHSVGALIAQRFAVRWPDDTAAVVLVDTSDLALWLDMEPPQLTVEDGDNGIPFDVTRSIAELAEGDVPALPAYVVSSRPGRWLDLPEERRAYWASFTLDELDVRWQKAQRELAERWSAVHLIASVGGHRVQEDQPAIVVEAIHAAVAAGSVRSDEAGSLLRDRR